MKAKMKIYAEISISRPQCSDGRKFIRLVVNDGKSCCRILDLEIPLDGFSEALTGMSNVACTGDFYEDAPVGKFRHTKDEMVTQPKGFVMGDAREATAKKLLKKYEVDGWEINNPDDLFNHHRWVGDKVRVTFVRYCDEPPVR